MPDLLGAKPGRPGSNGAGPFQELLWQLQEEHERQLEALRAQVSSLQGQLGRLGAFTAGKGAAAAPLCVQTASNGKWDSKYADSPVSLATALDPSAIPLTFSRDNDDQVDSRPYSSSEVLELKGVWKELIRQHAQRNSDFQRLSDSFDFHMDQLEEKDEDEDKEAKSSCLVKFFKHGVISPNSSGRLYWECTGLVLVCFDMINIPLATVYEPDETPFSITMDWITLLFWTADMLQGFFVGFYSRGHLKMTQPEVVIHYLRTWFSVDALVVLPDWFLTIAGSRTQAGDLSRLLRTSRAIRVLRLLRVMKLQRVINKLYDMIDNEYSFIIAELVKMMIVILVLNHVIACGWFGTGKIAVNYFELPSWVTWSENFLEADIGYQYSTSLHWTLTQFTPASMDVVARNICERVYSIIVLLFAMVAFSSIVGTVTSSMTVIRQMKNDKQKQFWMLRRYLKQKNVSLDLTMRMTRFLEHQSMKQQKLIQASKVTFLQQLSDQLSRELAYEMYEPFLKQHAFFRFLSKQMKGVAARICQMALKTIQVATDDTIFSVGEEASKSYIIKSGELGYMHNSGTILVPAEKEWLAEAAIWTNWRYRGKAFATKPSDLLSVEAGRFAEAMSIHPKPVSIARHYGQKFVGLLNRQSPSNWTDILRDEDFYDGAVLEVGRQASQESISDWQVLAEEARLNGRYTPDETDADIDKKENVREVEENNAHNAQAGEDRRIPAPSRSRLGGGRWFTSGCFHACSSEQVFARQPAEGSSGRANFW